MPRFKRLFIALMIFLSGLALVPHFSLPDKGFDWQAFAQAYEPGTFVYLPLILRQDPAPR